MLPIIRTRQPSTPVAIAAGLPKPIFVGVPGIPFFVDLGTSATWTFPNTPLVLSPSIVPSPGGLGHQVTSSATALQYQRSGSPANPGYIEIPSGSDWSLVFQVNNVGFAGTNPGFFRNNSTLTGNTFFIYDTTTTIRLRNNGTDISGSTNRPATGSNLTVVLTVRSGTRAACWVNGRKEFDGGTAATAAMTGTSGIFALGTQFTGEYISGVYTVEAWFAGAINDGLAQRLSVNPWQMFQPIPRRIFVASTGTGPTYTLTAAQGSFTLTGQAAGLTASRLLTAAQGSYTLTGQAATLKAARLITAAQGSYTLTGQAATLTYTPLVTYTLTAAQGAFTLTGQAAGLTAARVLTAAQGTYSLTGVAASLSVGSGLLRGRPMRRSRRPIWVIEGSKKKCLRRRCERSGNISPRLQRLPTLFRSSERFGRRWN